MPEVATYSIGAVARMVRVPPATLRTWEERYGIVQPLRSEGGHRLYSRMDVERLRFVADRVRRGSRRATRTACCRGYPATSRSPAADPGTQIVILLAERDPYAAEFAEYFLKTEGFEVVLALDAADAVGAVEADRPQLAIIDLLISGGAGLELCRDVHARGIPVLALSSVATRDAALEAGASAFLQKPLEPLQLVSAVKDLLGRARSCTRSYPRGDGSGLQRQRAARRRPGRRVPRQLHQHRHGSARFGEDDPGAAVRVRERERGPPAVYLSTVSEPLEKILRYGQTLSFFDPNAIGSRVFYEDLGTSLSHQDA